MDIFRSFAIRKAQVIAASVKGVEVNQHAQQASISIRAEEDPRSELRMILGRAELEDLHRRLSAALAELPTN